MVPTRTREAGLARVWRRVQNNGRREARGAAQRAGFRELLNLCAEIERARDLASARHCLAVLKDALRYSRVDHCVVSGHATPESHRLAVTEW
jgi:hypothetical protein